MTFKDVVKANPITPTSVSTPAALSGKLGAIDLAAAKLSSASYPLIKSVPWDSDVFTKPPSWCHGEPGSEGDRQGARDGRVHGWEAAPGRGDGPPQGARQHGRKARDHRKRLCGCAWRLGQADCVRAAKPGYGRLQQFLETHESGRSELALQQGGPWCCASSIRSFAELQGRRESGATVSGVQVREFCLRASSLIVQVGYFPWMPLWKQLYPAGIPEKYPFLDGFLGAADVQPRTRGPTGSPALMQ